MAAWTSCSATSSDRSRPNCRVTTEAPAEETDDIRARLAMAPNWRSSGPVTVVVITSGEAPGKKVCTWMVG